MQYEIGELTMDMEEQSKRRETEITEIRSRLRRLKCAVKFVLNRLELNYRKRCQYTSDLLDALDSLKIPEIQLKQSIQENDDRKDMMVDKYKMYQSVIFAMEHSNQQLEMCGAKEITYSRELEMRITEYHLFIGENEELIKTSFEGEMTELENLQSVFADLKDKSQEMKNFLEAYSEQLYNILEKHKNICQKQFDDVQIEYNQLMHMINETSFKPTFPIQQIAKQWAIDIKNFYDVNKETRDRISQYMKKLLQLPLVSAVEELAKMSTLAITDKSGALDPETTNVSKQDEFGKQK